VCDKGKMMPGDLQRHSVGKHQIIIDQRIWTLSANTKGEVCDLKRSDRESGGSSRSDPFQRNSELSLRRDYGQRCLRDQRVLRGSFLELQNHGRRVTERVKH